MIVASDVLRIAVSHGLPGAELLAAADGRVPQLSDGVIEQAAAHRVLGVLWTAIDDGVVAGEDHLVERASERLSAALRTCLVSEQTAVLAIDALAAAGVEARVLKGVAIAHLDHDNPAERIYGDADMLIRREDYPQALTTLERAGFRRAQPPVRGWWEQRFGKAIVLRAPSGAELDLHLAITGGYFGTQIDHDELWASPSETFDLAGSHVVGLDAEGRFLHACCHAVLGGGSGLRALRDIAQLVLISGADWRSVVARAERDEVELVLAVAARVAWTELGLDHHHEFVTWAAGHAPDPVQERVLAGYVAAREQGWAPEGRSVMAALGRLDRARFLAGLAFPSNASMQARQRTWGEHFRQGAATLLHRH